MPRASLRWDQVFVEAVTWGLAARICYELTGREDRTQTLTHRWQTAFAQATAASANEGSFGREVLPEALRARGYEA